MREVSCGTVLFTVKDKVIHYLLIKNRVKDCYGFPKGHMEEGETEQETALRETWEETSIKAQLVGDFRASVTYTLKNGNEKTVVYFLASFFDQTPAHNPGFENYSYHLLPFNEAHNTLTFDNTKNILYDAEKYIKSGGFTEITVKN